MKVYIVCRTWADSYEDHGWEILDTFKDEYQAAALVNLKIKETSEDSSDDFYYDELEVKESKSDMTKAEMFDFILMNNVEIALDGCWYTKQGEDRFQNKYRVNINGSGMCGFDLEEAIQYYRDNLEVR